MIELQTNNCFITEDCTICGSSYEPNHLIFTINQEVICENCIPPITPVLIEKETINKLNKIINNG